MKIRLRKRIKLLIIAAAIIFGFNFYLDNNYTVVSPGVTVELKDIVTVEKGVKKGKGSFFLTTVSSRQLNIPLLIYSVFTPNVSIEKKEDVIPPGWSIKQYMDYMRSWMQESQKIAEVVALKKSGFNPVINGDGAQIMEIMQDSPAKNILLPGDIIKSVDFNRVHLAEEVVQRVSATSVGDTVVLEVDRDGSSLRLPVTTMKSKNDTDTAVIGVYISTLNWNPILPLKIEINTGDIGGPSAGSMFAMEILNQLSERDLTNGKKIAGTGTISLDETIGEIGGVRHKVAAAYRDGAEIFFTPEKNAKEAFEAAKGLNIKVISVKNLDDIIQYLSQSQ